MDEGCMECGPLLHFRAIHALLYCTAHALPVQVNPRNLEVMRQLKGRMSAMCTKVNTVRPATAAVLVLLRMRS